ncbi:MAG: hypothetical protein PVG72_06835 [Gammaproteobacteria bacterium]
MTEEKCVPPVNPTITVEPASGKNSSSRASRARRSRASYRCDAKIRRYKYLLASISILFLLIYIFTWLQIAGKSREYERTLLELRKQQVTMQAVNTELETLRNELDTLVQERIPGLLPLKFDEAINIDNTFIRNIIFTEAINGKKRNFEYRLVMHNDSLSVILPKVEILLFNDIGIQIGAAHVEYTDASSEASRAALDPGEVRSYTSAINLLRNEEPRYFLLATTEGKQASADKLREHLSNVISP